MFSWIELKWCYDYEEKKTGILIKKLETSLSLVIIKCGDHNGDVKVLRDFYKICIFQISNESKKKTV